MPTYEQLLAELQLELGEGHPALSRLPVLIRETEDYLWNILNVPDVAEELEINVSAGQWRIDSVDTSKWIEPKAVLWNGELLDKLNWSYFRAQRRMFPDLRQPQWWTWTREAIEIWGPPYADGTLVVIVLKKEDYCQPGDNEQTKWMLGDGYNLLKYGVLALRVFDPERWAAWKQQFDRELQNYWIGRSRKGALGRRG